MIRDVGQRKSRTMEVFVYTDGKMISRMYIVGRSTCGPSIKLPIRLGMLCNSIDNVSVIHV
jgi:hypothetical protein